MFLFYFDIILFYLGAIPSMQILTEVLPERKKQPQIPSAPDDPRKRSGGWNVYRSLGHQPNPGPSSIRPPFTAPSSSFSSTNTNSNPRPSITIGDGVRKIPFTLIHGGKIKAIAVKETSTIAELRKTIYSISKCSAKYDITHLDLNKEWPDAAELKHLKFPSSNRVFFHCNNEYCRSQFTNENLAVTSTSTEQENIQVYYSNQFHNLKMLV